MSDPFALRDTRGAAALLGGGLLRNLRAGTRLALFLPVRWLEFRASAADYAVLVAFNTLLWLAGGLARAQGDVRLDAAAIAVYLGTVPLILLGAMAIARLYRNAALALLLAVALSASDLAVEVAGILLAMLPLPGAAAAAAYALYFAWLWLIAIRAVSVCTGARGRRLLKGACAVVALAAVLMFAWPRAEPWVAGTGAVPAGPALADEALFHAQGELIEASLQGIARGKPGESEFYFVGFAPDGSQDVFQREMRFVKGLFDERFGTAGRSIALVSGETTLREFPVATQTNLRRSLARVAERMNADEDVLFLFVSAHGDARHDLSAWQPPLVQAPLNPTALARMLQDAGVKWKVVVVSACYAGGFIEPLKDPHTLIIAASAADRQSFGCESGRDFTYFGEAFFRDALAGTRSLTEAFERAKEIVARREEAEQKTASQPQLWAGERIEAQLRRLASQPAAR